MMRHSLNVAGSVLASNAALWRGTAAFRPAARQPDQPLTLYDIETCPYCRLVREALTELDLDALIQPCPKKGTRFRPVARQLGDKSQFPFLHDPNTGARLYESANIVRYLERTYDGRVSTMAGPGRTLTLGASMLASGVRGLAGMWARPSRAPEQPLELYSFESSPYSRLVREALCELELPYVLRNSGKARWTDRGPPAVRDRRFKAAADTGRNRKRLFERTGRVQVPYLIDPNTGTALFESADIVACLERTYAV